MYDLGSGDGRIVIEAAKKYGCQSVGLEIDRDLVKLPGACREAKVEKLVTIKEADLFASDFSDATLIAVYLYPDMLKRLMPKFALLKPGTRIVSRRFGFPINRRRRRSASTAIRRAASTLSIFGPSLSKNDAARMWPRTKRL